MGGEVLAHIIFGCKKRFAIDGIIAHRRLSPHGKVEYVAHYLLVILVYDIQLHLCTCCAFCTFCTCCTCPTFPFNKSKRENKCWGMPPNKSRDTINRHAKPDRAIPGRHRAEFEYTFLPACSNVHRLYAYTTACSCDEEQACIQCPPASMASVALST